MKYIALLLTFLAITQCSEKESHFINGSAPGVTNGLRVYINDLDENGRQVVIDTSIVMDERFYFDQKDTLDREKMRFLTLDGSKGNLVLLVQNQKLDITIKKDSLYASDIKGSASNKALQDFKAMQLKYTAQATIFKTQRNAAARNQDQVTLNDVTDQWVNAENDFKKYATDLITSNSKSIVSPMILGELLNSKLLNATESRAYYNKFDSELKNSIMAKRIDAFLSKAEATAVGAKAPDFEAPDPNGNSIKLSQVLGKVTLVDFWASWCGPCRRENPNVVAAYNKYHDKGFNILSVSLDRKGGERAWKAAIEKDKMDWNHVSRLQYFGPLAKLYNVNAIPATFLLDENGIIVETNLRGKQLHDKLEELLGTP